MKWIKKLLGFRTGSAKTQFRPKMKLSQKQLAYLHLKKEPLNKKKAKEMYGIVNLPSQITKLRNKGMDIRFINNHYCLL